MRHFLNLLNVTLTFAFCLLSFNSAFSEVETIEILDLDVIPYEAFKEETEEALFTLKKALYEKGIVGIKGIPGYKEKVLKFIETAREFSALPEEVKESYAPDHSKGEMFLGYEKGKEKFKRPDGKWVIDDLKVSYYAVVPDSHENKWPTEVDLQTPFQELGNLMSNIGKAVMEKIGLVGDQTGISIDGIFNVGRMLYYRKSENSPIDNPYWCGAHFDHSLFTALLPAFYFVDGQPISEPMDAGLFVKTSKYGTFEKVVANDPDVLMFQVGEFGQLATDDLIKATEHRVHKAQGCIERYTMALFFDPPLDTKVYSTSSLNQDARYGQASDGSCTFHDWKEESFKRYIVAE